MSKPDDTPFSITQDALKAMSMYALSDPEVETCGFLLGRNGVANRVVAVRNVAEDRTSTFEMSHDGILETYKEADENGEDVLAVFHSHPTSEAIPSERDKSVPDIDPVQVIVSLKDGQPRCRAWRLDVPFMGERRATEVMLFVSDDGQPFQMKPSILPWALTPGNDVLLEYTRRGYGQQTRVLSAKVKGVTSIHEGTPDEQHSVLVETPRKTDPKVIELKRIRGAQVVRESKAAQRMRLKLAMLARRAAHLVQEQSYDDLPEIMAILAAAFPADVSTTVKITEGKTQ